MGSLTDPIYVKVSTHTQSPDGTTRNDTFYMSSVLNAYQAQLANNIATPVYNMVIAEMNALGYQPQATPVGSSQYTDGDWYYTGTAAGGPVQLKCEVGVGFQPLATPVRYHLTKYDQLSTPISSNLTVGGQLIYGWIDGILQKLTYQNVYTGAPYANG